MEKLNLNPAEVSSPQSDENSRALKRKSLILRCQGRLYSAYRTDQYADPDGFMASLGMVFGQYPDDVVEYITSPLTGIQRGKTFPPSIAEIVSACDARLADLAQMRRYRNWGKNDPDTLALEGPKNETRPSYDDLQAKYGPNFGLGKIEEEARAKSAKPAPTAEQLKHHYAHYNLGFVPKESVE